VSQDHSRKHFLAKFIGLIAVGGFVPKLFSRPAGAAGAAPGSDIPAARPASFQLKPETRAVARRADSV
jgi:hypothetical protein